MRPKLFHKTLLFTSVLFATGVTIGSAAAQNLSKLTAVQVERALSDAGFSPKIIKKNTKGKLVLGGTITQSKGSKIKFWVRTRGCKGKPTACENFIFFANFNLGRDVKSSDFHTMNSFNDTQVYGRAYVLKKSKQIGVDLMLDLSGGVSRKHLSQRIQRWPKVVKKFMDRVRAGNKKQKKL